MVPSDEWVWSTRDSSLMRWKAQVVVDSDLVVDQVVAHPYWSHRGNWVFFQPGSPGPVDQMSADGVLRVGISTYRIRSHPSTIDRWWGISIGSWIRS